MIMNKDDQDNGRKNFYAVSQDLSRQQLMPSVKDVQQLPDDDLNRRGFLKTSLAAGAVLPVSASVYFGYGKMEGRPHRLW
jgi:hypothetical protein